MVIVKLFSDETAHLLLIFLPLGCYFQVIEITDYRAQLYDYLKNRMTAIAPNLTILVGELVGARLIAHAGSLLNLAKHPSSTVQILGAEKALFRLVSAVTCTLGNFLCNSSHNFVVTKLHKRLPGVTRLALHKVESSSTFHNNYGNVATMFCTFCVTLKPLLNGLNIC